jgi:hypothetical protein
VSNQYIPHTTGPGALKVAVANFLGTNETYRIVTNTTYMGPNNSSMTIDGGKCMSSNPSWRIVIRETIKGKKKREAYMKMGMVHFNHAKKPKLKDSCLVHLYKRME